MRFILNCSRSTVLHGLLLAIGLVTGCGPGGTTTGNPLITLKSAPYSTGFARFGLPFISEAHAAVSSLNLCFKRLRFKTTSNSDTMENYDFNPGMVALSASGNTLGAITLPNGTYRRVEFDLESGCGTDQSVSFWNDSPFSTSDRITVRFDGEFTVSGENSTLTLDFQPLVTALNTITNSNQISDALEAVSGSF